MITYTVEHPNGSSFWVAFASPAIDNAWREVVKSLPDSAWSTVCERLLRITDQGPPGVSRRDCVTSLDASGAYVVRLSPTLARMPTEFQKGAIAHELAHVVRDDGRSAKGTELDELREEYLADKQVWDWGFQIDGLARHVRYMLAAGSVERQRGIANHDNH